MSKTTIGIIGGGNMGEALIKGLYQDYRIGVCEADARRVQALKKKYRVAGWALSTLVYEANILVLAVKPQDMAGILEQIKKTPPGSRLFISIAAGLTTKFFEQFLGNQPRVVRTMPNMPALIGEGITAICAGRYVRPADLKLAQGILGAIGRTVIVKENMIDAVTAVSGSGPAYVFLFVEQWMAAARKLGFTETQAKELVYQTMLGSTHLLENSELNAAALRAKVTSKGGTTQAAMDVFFKRKFDHIMKQALAAAKKRANELAQ